MQASACDQHAQNVGAPYTSLGGSKSRRGSEEVDRKKHTAPFGGKQGEPHHYRGRCGAIYFRRHLETGTSRFDQRTVKELLQTYSAQVDLPTTLSSAR